MRNKPTVTIGIPAYNEEANIGNLISSLLVQKSQSYILKQIIVVSDKSNDNTNNVVKSIKDSRIQLYRNKLRVGKAISQNHIIKNFNTDILVLFDADVLPSDSSVVENIVKPLIRNRNIGLVSGRIVPLAPKNFPESILYLSRQMKEEIYLSINKYGNLYLCHGRFRAFSCALAKKMNWESTFGEDAFSYLSCISKGFSFRYASTAIVYYKLPDNIKDHFKQSVRFLGAKEKMKNYFDERLVNRSYMIPVTLKIRVFMKYLLRRPISMVAYFGVYCYAKILSLFNQKNMSIWEASSSSKNLLKNY